jgi:hypothetical protein
LPRISALPIRRESGSAERRGMGVSGDGAEPLRCPRRAQAPAIAILESVIAATYGTKFSLAPK